MKIAAASAAARVYWAATVGSVFEVAICAAIGTLEVASV
jgi:hypothetical protein